MKIAFVRGQYLNNFELQSYYPLLKLGIKLYGFSSLKPKHQVKIPTKKLISPVDLPNFPYKLPILNRLFIDAMYLWGLENKLNNFDLVHVRETYFHFSVQAIKAKLAGKAKKVLVTCSETIPFNHETIWGRKKFKQIVRDNADHFHCLTEKAKKTLIAEGVNKNKITVIPYGIDLEHFKFQKRQFRTDKINLLFIARQEVQKGVFTLLKSWQKLKLDKRFNLRVVGKGSLAHLWRKEGIQPEFVPYKQVPKLMHWADILILPSQKDKYWEEYFGMVLLEAMAMGLPIIGSDCGVISEVVGDAGIIVPQKNPDLLYNAIISLSKDLNKRQALSKNGLKRAQTNFSADKQALKLKKLYEKIA